MLKYAKIIDDISKRAEVGSGTNAGYYQSIGMVQMKVEQGYDGAWYVKGFAPQKPTELQEAEVREQRNHLLSETDKFMVADYPIEEDERERYRAYRQYLRNLPSADGFPEVEILTFEQWNNTNGEGA